MFLEKKLHALKAHDRRTDAAELVAIRRIMISVLRMALERGDLPLHLVVEAARAGNSIAAQLLMEDR